MSSARGLPNRFFLFLKISRLSPRNFQYWPSATLYLDRSQFDSSTTLIIDLDGLHESIGMGGAHARGEFWLKPFVKRDGTLERLGAFYGRKT